MRWPYIISKGVISLKKRGRPRTDEAKNRVLKVRMDESTRDKLMDISMETDLSMSEIVRRAIVVYYRNCRKNN